MKKILQKISFIIALLVIGDSALQAQILINNLDMPVVNDTFRLSSAAPLPTADPALTGANYTWDYSWLIPFAQNVDTFKSVASAGGLYAFFFINNGSNVNRANLVTKGPEFPSVPGVAISNVLGFVYNSTASYKQVGIGANINGTGIPVAYNPHDIIYKFPMNFENVDSSNSAFSLALPGLGYYGYTLKRNNEVDGWGNLTTPFGTFPTLRVKSTMIQKDTLYVDSLMTGFALDRPLTVEYKWLADNKGIPLLTIITQETFTGPLITSITYRDSARVITVGQNEIERELFQINLYPNPSKGISSLEIMNNQPGVLELEIRDIKGRLKHQIEQADFPVGNSRMIMDAKSLDLGTGIYFVNVVLNKQSKVFKWVITE